MLNNTNTDASSEAI